MQDFFSSWAAAVTIAVLFCAIISSMLPETGIKKYIAVVLGLAAAVIILSPLFGLFGGTDFKKEIENALDGLDAASEYKYDSSLYGDYILKVYKDSK